MDQVRQAAGQRVADTSLRATAREAGVSTMALRAFLDGSEPYDRNRRKLFAWHAGAPERRPAQASPETAAAALALLSMHLAPPGAEALRAEIAAIVQEEGGEAPPPGWLDTPPPDG